MTNILEAMRNCQTYGRQKPSAGLTCLINRDGVRLSVFVPLTQHGNQIGICCINFERTRNTVATLRTQ